MTFIECVEQTGRELGYSEKVMAMARTAIMNDTDFAKQSNETIPAGLERVFIEVAKSALKLGNWSRNN